MIYGAFQMLYTMSQIGAACIVKLVIIVIIRARKLVRLEKIDENCMIINIKKTKW